MWCDVVGTISRAAGRVVIKLTTGLGSRPCGLRPFDAPALALAVEDIRLPDEE